jgi:dihydroorotate dehydrogenase electron transfer subunit
LNAILNLIQDEIRNAKLTQSMHLPLKIHRIRQENPTFRTYVFKHGLRAKPGQFVMVWLPGVDEVPMSIGWQDENEFWIGMSKVGDCTTAIFDQIKEGDKLGIRGPFGKSFELKKGQKKIVLVGGGFGTPPLLFLAQEAAKSKIKMTVILGARSADHILYEKEFRKLGCEVKMSTDDGTKGHKGFCTEVFEKWIEKEKVDCVYTCGPEKMMKRVAQIAYECGIDSQVSLERYMKCGFGICGQCCMDESGLRVCKDGPVVEGKVALKLKEFGKYARAASGRRDDLK